MTDCTLAALGPEYLNRWRTMTLRPGVREQANAIATNIIGHQPAYEAVGGGVPWWWIAAIHHMESDCDFSTHLHNGDPLTERTTHVPSGRPAVGGPPFRWSDSARDALMIEGLTGIANWPLAASLWRAERYNGFGMRFRGAVSDYLWAGTDQYTTGKFVADSVFDPHVVSHRVGIAALWLVMQSRGAFSFPAS